MKSRLTLIIFSLLLPLAAGDAAAGVSIGTRYGTIVLEHVEAGRVYNLTDMRDLPFLVMNRGSKKGNVRVSVLPPRNPREGYEPIADPNWLTVRPSEFELGGGESMPASLILNVPDNEEYIGRHYHALIRVENVTGGFFGAAVINNFFFSVGSPGPEEVQRAEAERILSELNYDINPETLFIDIPAGRKVNLLEELERSLLIINRGRQDVDLVVKSVPNDPGFPVREGYSFTPSTEYIWAEPESISVKSYQVRDVPLYAEIPEEHSGKRMMFVIAVYPEGMEFARLYSRVNVTVR